LIAIDTNLLVYAHRKDSPWHAAASALLRELAEGHAAWGIPWSCLHEFLAVVTHPRIYSPPSTVDQAIKQVDAWLESPSVNLLQESAEHWACLRPLVLRGKINGPRVHDARIAALCVSHGVRELWTADRDFTAFPALRTRNPLVSSDP
jgi:toxin-antitoxin system PIN domain toxin